MPSLRRKLPSANALFVFEAAARCGNFTRAAQELYVSQPAVSRMLSRMEDHIGVRLFVRVHGGIELTESGRILYRKISEGLTGIEDAIREIEARATGVEPVTLSVSTAFTTHSRTDIPILCNSSSLNPNCRACRKTASSALSTLPSVESRTFSMVRVSTVWFRNIV